MKNTIRMLLDPRSKLYAIGFVASFISFLLQIYAPQVFSFLLRQSLLHNSIPAAVSISFSFFGFSLGTSLVLLTRSVNAGLFLFLIPFTLIVSGFVLSLSVHLYTLTFCLSIIFIPLGAILTIGFKLLNTYRFYIVDFSGGLLGLVTGYFMLPLIMFETQMLLLITAITLISFYYNGKKFLILNVIVLFSGLFFLYLQNQSEHFNFIKYVKNIEHPINPSFQKNDSNEEQKNAFHNLKNGTHELLYSKWSYIMRVDVLKNLSDNEIELYYDNWKYSHVTKKAVTSYIFSVFQNITHTISIGTGGGWELAAIKYAGAQFITGVEINEATINLMKNELSDYSNQIYNKSNIILAEGRRFLEKTDQTYDLITFMWADSIPFFSSKSILEKDFLRTKKAIQTILRRLNKDGYAIWMSGLYNHPWSILNTISAISEILESTQKDPKIHLVILKGPRNSFIKTSFISENPRQEKAAPITKNPQGFLILKKSPFLSEELNKIEAFVKSYNSWSIIFPYNYSFPDNSRSESFFSEKEALIKKIILSDSRKQLLSNLIKSNIIPRIPSDEKPFIYYNIQKNLLLSSIYLVLFATGFLILCPLLKWRDLLIKNKSLTLPIFFCIFLGLLYGMIEVTLIELFNKFFINSIFGTAVILGSLLFGGTFAAYISSRLTLKQVLFTSGLLILYLPIVLVIASYNLAAKTTTLNFILVSALTTVLSFIFSLLFPKMLDVIKKGQAETIPFVYGGNVLMMNLGLFLAMCLYFYVGIIKTGLIFWGGYIVLLLLMFTWLKKHLMLQNY